MMKVNHYRMTFWQSSLLIACLFCYLNQATAQGRVEGYWVSPGGDAVISVEASSVAGELRLRIVSTLEPGQLDSENPNSTLRSRRIQGIELGAGFQQDGEWWTGGELYDPGSGNSYRARFQLLDEDHLRLRGYVGFSLIGRNETWTKLTLFKSQMQSMLGHGEGGSHDH